MDKFSFNIAKQYVKQTEEKERFPNKEGGYSEYPLHLVQKIMKLEFDSLPEFTIITAPTGTGKSYAFPFPVVNAKKNESPFSDKVKGLIVLPTNALINELHQNFTDTFPDIKISKITGQHLNELEVKGFSRWNKICEIAAKSDLVITNPDVLNYAMHGGYHKNRFEWMKRKSTGRDAFTDFLHHFKYVVFDEYHLYDESQIANILAMVNLRDIFIGSNVRFLFVSATAEPGLKEIFEKLDYTYREIIEEIVADSSNARAIHGNLKVELCSESDFNKLIRDNYSAINKELNEGRRVLLIFNKLDQLLLFKDVVEADFKGKTVYCSTGYAPKNEDQNKMVKDADIILATNKAEVGVNFDVQFCIMQTGYFYQNFVQRFGRVSRGDLEGQVIVSIDKTTKYNNFQTAIPANTTINYYDFTDAIRAAFQSRKFYSEIIPSYLGEYLWCIKNTLKKHHSDNTYKFFEANFLKEESPKKAIIYRRFKLLGAIDAIIGVMKGKFNSNSGDTKEWVEWWDKYLNTYLTFRDASKIVKVVDSRINKELEYSLDWILQWKEIDDIKEDDKGNKTYYVSNLNKERNTDLQYRINTIPAVNAMENSIVDFNQFRTALQQKKLFKKAVQKMLTNRRNPVGTKEELEKQLLEKLIALSETFSSKRINIEDIELHNPFL